MVCMGTPTTDGHVPMCIGVGSGYLPYILDFNPLQLNVIFERVYKVPN